MRDSEIRRIVVLGGGFAGLWSAVGAARAIDQLGNEGSGIEITLVNRDAFHSIRVRNYEADLTEVRVRLDDVLEPIGIKRVEGIVNGIDLAGQVATVQSRKEMRRLPYDRLVFALGSELVRPDIPGLVDHSFDIDTYWAAARLDAHLRSVPAEPSSEGQFTILVIGAGLTGIEAAAEMPNRLRDLASGTGETAPWRVILADRHSFVGSNMGDSARPVIEEALGVLGVEMRVGIDLAAVTEEGVTLRSGERILARTVVWCGGMRAHPLTRALPVELDPFGRLPVDEFLRVKGVPRVFAAGDSAVAMLDDDHASVMSCQHSRPMGRYAGHNVGCDLLEKPMLPLKIDWYVTVLDLGTWGAVYTEGWNRRVASSGAVAKATKQEINQRRIYPPLNRDRHAILDAAAPVVQRPPAYDEPLRS